MQGSIPNAWYDGSIPSSPLFYALKARLLLRREESGMMQARCTFAVNYVSQDPIVFTKKHQDVCVKMNWRLMDIKNPPSCSGVYAITNSDMTNWLYIGRSQNIAKRITAKNHPVQVTKDINVGQLYLYLCVPVDAIGWFEQYAIKRLNPEWNGGTSFGSSVQTPWTYCDVGYRPGFDEQMDAAVMAAIGA